MTLFKIKPYLEKIKFCKSSTKRTSSTFIYIYLDYQINILNFLHFISSNKNQHQFTKQFLNNFLRHHKLPYIIFHHYINIDTIIFKLIYLTDHKSL
jgi:hypothetical protein